MGHLPAQRAPRHHPAPQATACASRRPQLAARAPAALTHSSTAALSVTMTIFSPPRIGPMRSSRSAAACSGGQQHNQRLGASQAGGHAAGGRAAGAPRAPPALATWLAAAVRSQPGRPDSLQASSNNQGTTRAHLGRLGRVLDLGREQAVEHQRRDQQARPRGHQRRLHRGGVQGRYRVGREHGPQLARQAQQGGGCSGTQLHTCHPCSSPITHSLLPPLAFIQVTKASGMANPISPASLTHSRFWAAAVRYMQLECEEACSCSVCMVQQRTGVGHA